MNPDTNHLWTGAPKNYAQEQTRAMGAVAGANIPTPRPDPIPAQAAAIQANLDELHKALDLLTDKLGAVISSAEEPKEVGLATDSYGSSSLAVYLHSLGCSVASATMRVHALTRRIEL